MTIDPSTLQIDVEEQENWRRRLSVTVPAGQVQTERSKIIKKLGGKLKLPGFRSGKVPAQVVEQRFGQAVDQELLDNVIGEAYRAALDMESLEPISQGQMEDLEYEPREPLTFSISFDVQPRFDVSRVGGFAVQRPKIEVAEEDVQRVLERLREQQGMWKPEEGGAPEEGDQVAVHIWRLENGEPVDEGKPYELVLGGGEALPDVEDAIRTLAVGETGDFTVTFPDDFPDEERRGEKQHLRIVLESRRSRELPELDDEFARSLSEDFPDLDTVKEKVREDLAKEAAQQEESAVRAQLVEQILEANPFEVPRSMVERYMDSTLGDTSKLDPEMVSQTRESLRPEAEKAVKRILLVDRIAELQGLRADEDEVDDRIQAIAEANDVPPAQVYANMQKSGALEGLERELTEEKVYEFLKQESAVEEEG
jgi:trigger factor